jgi:CDP-diacylglycerol--serine O-phosphatidyltransferase
MNASKIIAEDMSGKQPPKPSTAALVAPNAVTAPALCSGLVSFYFAVEGAYMQALAAIVLSAILDGLDGRVARRLNASSHFGAEFDSLADVISFGAAPAFLVYTWSADRLDGFLALALMLFVLSSALRLARFNSSIDQQTPAWRRAYFTGMPTPAAAMAVLLPVVMFDASTVNIQAVALYAALVAYLMISTLPTFSGKGHAMTGRSLLAVEAALLSSAVLLVLHPRETFTVAVITYLASIPLSWLSFRRKAGRS